MSLARRFCESFLAGADVRIDGARDWDLTIHDERCLLRFVRDGSLGVGESYMDGWWDCRRIDELVARLLGGDLDDGVVDARQQLLHLAGRVVNLQSTWRAQKVAEVHYDLGNALFAAMLGPTMNYSCGYWRDADTLDAAQTAKMDLICRKLDVRPGDRVLDIGCGWGALARHLAEQRGARVTGITISAAQAEYARAAAAGQPVEILQVDYRSPELGRRGPFDKIVSVGMFEHVGRRNHRAFFGGARRLLTDDGLFLLHTIGNDHSATDVWLNRYIFPNGELPSTGDIAAAARGRFVVEDWHNFRADYDRTIMAWHANFERHAASPEYGHDARFYRMWRYYLLSMAGCFRADGRNQLWQIVLSPRGVPGGYRSVR